MYEQRGDWMLHVPEKIMRDLNKYHAFVYNKDMIQ